MVQRATDFEDDALNTIKNNLDIVQNELNSSQVTVGSLETRYQSLEAELARQVIHGDTLEKRIEKYETTISLSAVIVQRPKDQYCI